jgi:DNA-binding NarL/FixJ family response regulator
MYNVESDIDSPLDRPPLLPQQGSQEPRPPPPIPFGVLIVSALPGLDRALAVAIRAIPNRLRLVGSADTAAAGLNLARVLLPDVIVLDALIEESEEAFLDLLGALVEAAFARLVVLADESAVVSNARALELGAHALIARSRPVTDVAIAITATAQSERTAEEPLLYIDVPPSTE